MIHDVDEKKWNRAVSKLTILTARGELSWLEVSLPRRHSLSAFASRQYVADVNGKLIAVYESQLPSRAKSMSRFDPRSEIRVEFITSTGETSWVWPVSKGKEELLEAIQKPGSDAIRFLHAFLTDTV